MVFLRIVIFLLAVLQPVPTEADCDVEDECCFSSTEHPKFIPSFSCAKISNNNGSTSYNISVITNLTTRCCRRFRVYECEKSVCEDCLNDGGTDGWKDMLFENSWITARKRVCWICSQPEAQRVYLSNTSQHIEECEEMTTDTSTMSETLIENTVRVPLDNASDCEEITTDTSTMSETLIKNTVRVPLDNASDSEEITTDTSTKSETPINTFRVPLDNASDPSRKVPKSTAENLSSITTIGHSTDKTSYASSPQHDSPSATPRILSNPHSEGVSQKDNSSVIIGTVSLAVVVAALAAGAGLAVWQCRRTALFLTGGEKVQVCGPTGCYKTPVNHRHSHLNNRLTVGHVQDSAGFRIKHKTTDSNPCLLCKTLFDPSSLLQQMPFADDGTVSIRSDQQEGASLVEDRCARAADSESCYTYCPSDKATGDGLSGWSLCPLCRHACIVPFHADTYSLECAGNAAKSECIDMLNSPSKDILHTKENENRSYDVPLDTLYTMGGLKSHHLKNALISLEVGSGDDFFPPDPSECDNVSQALRCLNDRADGV